jgi:hypothetical protein
MSEYLTELTANHVLGYGAESAAATLQTETTPPNTTKIDAVQRKNLQMPRSLHNRAGSMNDNAPIPYRATVNIIARDTDHSYVFATKAAYAIPTGTPNRTATPWKTHIHSPGAIGNRLPRRLLVANTSSPPKLAPLYIAKNARQATVDGREASWA